MLIIYMLSKQGGVEFNTERNKILVYMHCGKNLKVKKKVDDENGGT